VDIRSRSCRASFTAWTDKTVTLLGGNQSGTIMERTFPLVEKNSSGTKTAEFIAFMVPVIV
jgi:hypothetical protein